MKIRVSSGNPVALARTQIFIDGGAKDAGSPVAGGGKGMCFDTANGQGPPQQSK